MTILNLKKGSLLLAIMIICALSCKTDKVSEDLVWGPVIIKEIKFPGDTEFRSLKQPTAQRKSQQQRVTAPTAVAPAKPKPSGKTPSPSQTAATQVVQADLVTEVNNQQQRRDNAIKAFRGQARSSCLSGVQGRRVFYMEIDNSSGKIVEYSFRDMEDRKKVIKMPKEIMSCIDGLVKGANLQVIDAAMPNRKLMKNITVTIPI